VQIKGELGGGFCSPRTEEEGGLTGGEEAAAKGLDDDAARAALR
jgi:hypothetical protein